MLFCLFGKPSDNQGNAMKKSRLFFFTFALGIGALLTCFLYEEGKTIPFAEAFGIKQRNLYHSEVSESTASESSHVERRRKVIFLVSSKRSGSSFVGEYFNKHSDIFYVFEPLQMLTFYVLEGKLNNSAFDDVAMDIMQGLVDCQFNHGYNSAKEWLTRKAPICIFNQELEKTKLCSEDHNEFTLTEVEAMLTATCETMKDIAFKVIRIQDLELIKPLVLNQTIDAKVLYLVRDPRGTMNSRNINEQNFDLIRRMQNTGTLLEVEDMCDTMEHNLKHYWLDTPTWLKGRIKMIRYEDVALNPIDLGKEIFQFIGRDFDLEVIKWLFLSTQDQSTDEVGKGQYFKTSRNSAKRVTGWRNEFSWSRISSIQNKCQTVMKMLGYLSIQSEVSLRNFSIPSFLPYQPLVNSTR
ncbi:carbohydrate sulfotransferase 1-like isoform X2 [Apostichopus japonicus]|uniref:carbohydrate sulfotransferase 1-like isoform X2 n=1 Tax=Stichopus japonicus TaxID=307972 RepID=UPI003AB58B58